MCGKAEGARRRALDEGSVPAIAVLAAAKRPIESGPELANQVAVNTSGHAGQVSERGSLPSTGFWSLGIVVAPILVILVLEIGVSWVLPLWGR